MGGPRGSPLGGGRNYFVRASEILKRLSCQQVELLRNTLFRFRVPREFFKDCQSRDLPLLYGDGQVRYRSEQISAIQDGGQELLDAFALAVEHAPRENLSLGDGQLLLMDNTRLLHARTEIRDFNRMLLRVRFNLKDLPAR